MSRLDIAAIRHQFPALSRQENGRTVIWADAPGGTQLPQSVIEAMAERQRAGVSNAHGAFAASADMDALTDRARERAACLFGCTEPETLHFGANTTSLSFAISHSVAADWQAGDSIIVTELDHDANVRPWVLAATARQVSVKVWPIRADGCLHTEDLDNLLDESVRLLAVTAAGNSLGSLVDVIDATAKAHAVGAIVAVDAVHYAPHRALNANGWNCDILTCSPYKFFGPHIGVQYLHPELDARLQPLKVIPAPDHGAARWETGTVNLEGLAGFCAVVDYLCELGGGQDRTALVAAWAKIVDHEQELSAHFLKGIERIPSLRVHGPGLDALDRRTPTFGISSTVHDVHAVAAKLGQAGIYSWSGHFYAINMPQALGVDALLRIGFAHYHSLEELDRVLDALEDICT